MDRGARGAGTADVPLGTAPVAAVPAAPRSSPLSAIGVYIASTHVVLVVAATVYFAAAGGAVLVDLIYGVAKPTTFAAGLTEPFVILAAVVALLAAGARSICY